MKSYSPETIAEIRTRYANGESSYKLAKEYYMSQKGLYAYVANIKRPMPSRRTLSPKRIQQMREGYMSGATIYEIAYELGISHNCVYTYVKDLVRKGA